MDKIKYKKFKPYKKIYSFLKSLPINQYIFKFITSNDRLWNFRSMKYFR